MKNCTPMLTGCLLLVLGTLTQDANARDYYQQLAEQPAKLYQLEQFYLSQSAHWTQTQRPMAALHTCGYLLKVYPNHPRALNTLVSLASQGIPLTSIQPYFDHALKRYPGQSMTHFLAGELYQATNQSDLAIPCYQQAIAHDPQRGFYHYALAQAHLQNEQITLAQAALKEAIRLQFNTEKIQAMLQQNPVLQIQHAAF